MSVRAPQMNTNGFSDKNRRGSGRPRSLTVRVSSFGRPPLVFISRRVMLCTAAVGLRVSLVREVNAVMKKVLTWGAVAFVIYYLATSPQGAANVVTGAIDWLKSAGNSLSAFLNHIRL
jgi:hypothetical protein